MRLVTIHAVAVESVVRRGSMVVGALDALIGMLEAQPCAERFKFAIRRDGIRATVYRGGMQAGVRDVGDGTVEVAYEHELHEVTRVRVGPEQATRLLLALMQRDRLVRIEVPDAEDGFAPDDGRTTAF